MVLDFSLVKQDILLRGMTLSGTHCGSLEAARGKDFNGVTILQLGVKERSYYNFLRDQEHFSRS